MVSTFLLSNCSNSRLSASEASGEAGGLLALSAGWSGGGAAARTDNAVRSKKRAVSMEAIMYVRRIRRSVLKQGKPTEVRSP